MKTYLVICLLFAAACNEQSSSQNESRDTMPVVKPDTVDTSRVMTTPPTGDSNVVNTDSTAKSK
jgi:hypothetical protein